MSADIDEGDMPVMPPDARAEWSPWQVRGVERDEHPTYVAQYVPGSGNIFTGPLLGSMVPSVGSRTIWERRKVAFWTDDQGRKCAQVVDVETIAHS